MVCMRERKSGNVCVSERERETERVYLRKKEEIDREKERKRGRVCLRDR